MLTKFIQVTVFLPLLFLNSYLQASASVPTSQSNYQFQIMPLGTSGGNLDSNLSSYLVATIGANNWLALDAGSLCDPINHIAKEEFDKLKVQPIANKNSAEIFFKDYLKAYLISHAHLDHIAGLVICSVLDSNKEILALDSTIDYLRDYIFNGKIWVNFGDEGIEPLKKYHYHRLALINDTPVPHTNMTVRPFLLSHGQNYPSTAFLLQANGNYLLYFGDTGADSVERSEDIEKIWKAVAPLIKEHKLRGIFIEVSYLNNRPKKLLFGHLTPELLLAELKQLALIVNPENPKIALKNLKVIVTHVKEGFDATDPRETIIAQLNEKNDLGVEFILPQAKQLLML